MNDSDLADEIIVRLNQLCENPDVRADFGRLIESRVACSAATLAHPSIQAVLGADKPGASAPVAEVGFLGFLNGLVGTIPAGPRMGWGFIAAEFDDDGNLKGFMRTV